MALRRGTAVHSVADVLSPYSIIDGFLDDSALAELRLYARERRERFKPAAVRVGTADAYQAAARQSLRVPVRDDELPLFRGAVATAASRLFDDLGISAQPVVAYELEMVAHGNGGFFKRHIDTFTGRGRTNQRTDRLLSTVFYFGLGPRRFAGGELLIHPFLDGSEPAAIDPAPNRLVAFPSFAPHEVRPVTLADDTFENARFAVNCWLHRAGAAQ